MRPTNHPVDPVVVDNSVIKEYGEKAKNGVIFMETRPFHLKDALILLDGREIDSAQAQRIDNNAIKSIDVLKDETAVTRYGERARKGVISITTRHAGEVEDGQAARSEISVTAYPDQVGSDAPALEEIVTVAYPDEATDLRSTKLGRDKPLILLDGREISAEELFSFDKNSIKSIEVLKDETAIAQYGEKAKTAWFSSSPNRPPHPANRSTRARNMREWKSCPGSGQAPWMNSGSG